MESLPKSARTATLGRSARIVHRRVQSVITDSTPMQPPKPRVALLVMQESTVKCPELGKSTLRASHVHKARTRLPRV